MPGLRAVFLLLLTGLAGRAAPIDWPTLGFRQVVTNAFSKPTCITHAGDGSQRLFVAQQPGIISVISGTNVQADPFLVITDRVNSVGAEQGLLGVAFPPGFATNRHFYVDYTASNNAVIVSRFQVSSADTNVADAQSEEVILTMAKPFNNHNGGQLAFGPDGYLYIGVGDGGSEGDPQQFGQNPSSLLAKILRIDVENGVSPYAIPPSNPFATNSTYAPETWAWGLRNPWRFSFDRLTGDLYIGDVGQNQYEEIDFQSAGSPGGQNYGWRIMEGPTNYSVPSGFTNFSSLTLPVTWYAHTGLPSDISGAVTGGYVYRGPSQARMDGVYLYGDWVVGWIWGLKQDGTNWQNFALQTPIPPGFHMAISTFGEDELGQLYVADYFAGRIYQMFDTGKVWEPVFSAPSGTINSNTILVSCVSSGASIHFTTNAVDPTVTDPVVPPDGILRVSSGLTNKVKAFRSDLQPSDVASAVFSLKVGALVFSPGGGATTNGTLVTISTSTPGAAVYYTIDGTTPGTNSLLYSGPLLLQRTTTLKAIGVAPGFANSDIKNGTYSIPQTAFPVFSPPAGRVQYGTGVSITCATAGAAIYYTIDGTMPSSSSLVYTSAIPITGDVEFIAFADAPGDANSLLITNTYRLPQAPPPVFDPPAGPLTNGARVSITPGSSNAVIFYTMDGTIPTTNSAVYSGAFTFTNPFTLSASVLPPELDLSPPQKVRYGRRVPESSVVTTIAGGPEAGWVDALGRNARLSKPLGLCSDRLGNLFVADNGNNVVRKIAPSGEVTTYAGSGVAGFQTGQSTNAQFTAPVGICADLAGDVFVFNADACDDVSEIDTNLNVTLYKSVGASLGLCADVPSPGYMGITAAGTIYLGIKGEVQELRADGNLLTLTDPTLIFHGFSFNIGPAPDPANNVYIATEYKIWRRSAQGNLSLFAGSTAGYSDDLGTNAWFQGPQDVVIDANTNIFVSDGSSVRKLRPDGSATTLAGVGTAGYVNGPGAVAQFNGAAGICLDTNGNVFVADSGNNCIREISPDTAGIGIADWWQLAHFGKIGIDPNGDPDHDGMSNYAEFWAGTDPLDGTSALRIESPVELSGGQAQIRWRTVVAKTYVVQYSTDLISWKVLGNPIQGDGSVASVSDPAPGADAEPRYYRIALTAF